MGRNVAETLFVFLSALTAGCASDHHVSPWGERGRVSVDLYVAKPDLGAQLAQVDREIVAAHGLGRTLEIDGRFGRKGAPFRIRGYAGKDSLGRPIHAVRVATQRAVVLAVGPIDLRDVDRSRATELVPALLPGPNPARPLEGAAFASGGDLTGDGSPSVVLRSDAGVLEIWHLAPLGAAAYAIAMLAKPTSAADVDRDGRVDLLGELTAGPDDTLHPRLAEVATFEGGRFSDTTRAARTWHRARLTALDARAAGLEKPSDEDRLTRVIERTWHAAFAGEPPESTFAQFDREPVPKRLAAEVERWRKIVAEAATRR